VAAISVTAANVKPFASDAVIRMETAGATITAGQLLYQDSSDSDKVKLLDVDSTGSAASATLYGVAMAGASADDPIAVLIAGTFNCGGTVAAGAWYFGHPSAGSFTTTFSDLQTGDRSTLLGYATTTSLIKLVTTTTGITVA
jgi:hypothetical protein